VRRAKPGREAHVRRGKGRSAGFPRGGRRRANRRHSSAARRHHGRQETAHGAGAFGTHRRPAYVRGFGSSLAATSAFLGEFPAAAVGRDVFPGRSASVVAFAGRHVFLPPACREVGASWSAGAAAAGVTEAVVSGVSVCRLPRARSRRATGSPLRGSEPVVAAPPVAADPGTGAVGWRSGTGCAAARPLPFALALVLELAFAAAGGLAGVAASPFRSPLGRGSSSADVSFPFPLFLPVSLPWAASAPSRLP